MLAKYHYSQVAQERDLAAAFNLYKLSAEAQFIEAQHKLALCYKNGLGVSADPPLAFRHFKASAERGHAQSLSELGHCF